MTKFEALQNFWSSFEIPAYPNTAVPSDAVMPYITYDWADGDIHSGQMNTTAEIWYYTTSEKVLNDKLAEVSHVFGLGGVRINYDGGLMWLTKGSPWANPYTDPADSHIKRRVLNVNVNIV